jgi:hypothetical protein
LLLDFLKILNPFHISLLPLVPELYIYYPEFGDLEYSFLHLCIGPIPCMDVLITILMDSKFDFVGTSKLLFAYYQDAYFMLKVPTRDFFLIDLKLRDLEVAKALILSLNTFFCSLLNLLIGPSGLYSIMVVG